MVIVLGTLASAPNKKISRQLNGLPERKLVLHLFIFLQDEQPEGDKAAYWLATLAEPFCMALRIYDPEESVMNNEWAPPPVQRVD